MPEIRHVTGIDGMPAPGWQVRTSVLSDQELSEAMADRIALIEDHELAGLYLEMVVRWRTGSAGQADSSGQGGSVAVRTAPAAAPREPVSRGLREPPAGSQLDRSGWLAERFGVSRATVLRWRRTGRWPAAVGELLALEDGTHPAWPGFRVLAGEIISPAGARISRADVEMVTWWLQQALEANGRARHYRQQLQALDAPPTSPRVVNLDQDAAALPEPPES